MSIIKTTRLALELTQPQFGQWLSDQIGRIQPIEVARISEWEHGKKSPRALIREVCQPIAATHAAREIMGMDICDRDYEAKASKIIIESME